MARAAATEATTRGRVARHHGAGAAQGDGLGISAALVDLLDNPRAGASASPEGWAFDLRPWEIATLRLPS